MERKQTKREKGGERRKIECMRERERGRREKDPIKNTGSKDWQ